MKGRLGGWPMPMTVFLPEYAVELAMEMVSNGLTKDDVCTSEYLQKFAKDKFNIDTQFEKLKDNTDNYQVMVMDQIVY